MPTCAREAAAVTVDLFDRKPTGLQENREGHGLALTRDLLDLCPSRRPSMNQALILVVHGLEKAVREERQQCSMVFVRVFLLVTVQDAAEALDHSFFAQAMARNSSSSSAVVPAVAGSGASPPAVAGSGASPPAVAGSGAPQPAATSASAVCACSRHCWQPNHRTRGCQAAPLTGERLCRDCICQLHPDCSKPRYHSPWCFKHKAVLEQAPGELMMQYYLRDLLADLVPCDIEAFLDVCRESTRKNMFLELVFALVKEPQAIKTMQGLMSDHLTREGDTFMLDAPSVARWWTAAVISMDGLACQPDHANLGRQGAPKHVGFLRTSQKFGMLAPPPLASPAGPAAQASVRKRPAAQASVRKRPAAAASAGGSPPRRRHCLAVPDSAVASPARIVRLGANLAAQQLIDPENMSVITEALKVCTTATLPAVREESDVLPYMRAYLDMLRRLPSSLCMGGDYVSMHVARKHLLLTVSRLTAPPTWASVTVGQLQELGPDRGKYLQALPSGWSIRTAGRAFGADPLLLGMFACLFHEALKQPGALAWCRQPGASRILRQLRDRYREEHGINPCPTILLRQALRTYPSGPRSGHSST